MHYPTIKSLSYFILFGFEFIGNSNSSNSDNAGTWNQPTDNSEMGFGDMTPVDDGDMPF